MTWGACVREVCACWACSCVAALRGDERGAGEEKEVAGNNATHLHAGPLARSGQSAAGRAAAGSGRRTVQPQFW